MAHWLIELRSVSPKEGSWTGAGEFRECSATEGAAVDRFLTIIGKPPLGPHAIVEVDITGIWDRICPLLEKLDPAERKADRERQQEAWAQSIPKYTGPPADPKTAAKTEALLAQIFGQAKEPQTRGSNQTLKQYEEATVSYYEPTAVDSKSANGWITEGDSLVAINRMEAAISCYNKALLIDPLLAEVWIKKGRIVKSHDEAIHCYEKALALEPRHAYAWMNKGRTLLILARYEEAHFCFDSALAINPESATAWNGKGFSLGKLGLREEGIACYDKALAIDPRNTDAWRGKGSGFAALGSHEQALVCHEKALAIDPLDATAWYNKGRAEVLLGRTADAIRSFSKTIEVAIAGDTEVVAGARELLNILQRL